MNLGEVKSAKHTWYHWYGIGVDWENHQENLFKITILVVWWVAATLFYHYTEPWSLWTIWYFLTATVTTVGYGDKAPSSQLSKLVTIFLLITGIYFVFNVINSFVCSAMERTHRVIASSKTDSGNVKHIVEEMDSMHRRHRKLYALYLFYILLLIFGWASIFWIWQPAQQRYTFIDMLYFCVATATTVGYGDVILAGENDKGRVIIFVFMSVVLFSAAVGTFVSIEVERAAADAKLEALSRPLDFAKLHEFDKDGKGIDLLHFLGAMLPQTHPSISFERDILPLAQRFKELDADGNGILETGDISLFKKNAQSEFEMRLEVVQTVEERHKTLNRNKSSNTLLLRCVSHNSIYGPEYSSAATKAADQKNVSYQTENTHLNPDQFFKDVL